MNCDKFPRKKKVEGVAMDIASLVGMLLGMGMVVYGIIDSGGTSAFGTFIDVASVAITFGGSLSSTLGSFKLADFINGFKSISLAFKETSTNPSEIIKSIIDLSNIGRKDGLLALEEAANGIEDDFLKKGVLLIVDGTDPELVRAILETDMMCLEDRHKNVISFWEKWAEMGPAWGMIGTLLGLINMLKNLSDPDSIGPNMSVALVTTLYGSIIANWLCAPIVAKLSLQNETEIKLKEVMIEGILSIQAGENPRVIEEKLKSFLTPASRELLSGSDAGGEE